MVKYLENNICEFELLFDIDYSKKTNILSACFFKMNKHYKNFSIYLDGLKRLIKLLEEEKNYKLRIFIDSHIKNDKEIFGLLSSSKVVQMVLFKCSDYIQNDYHLDVFGALVRLFPIFDFPNNDAKNVIIIDIDLKKEDVKSFKTVLNYSTNSVEIIGKGRAEDLMIIKFEPHFYLNLCAFYNKKYSSKIIIDFIEQAPNIKDKGLYNLREKTFGYGTDELFLNDYFIYKSDYTSKTQLGVLFDYDINWFLYHYKKDLLITEPKKTNTNLSFILEDYKKPNSSIEQMFDLIDKIIYKVDSSNTKKIFVSKKFYMLIKELIDKNLEWFDMKNLKLINKYYHNIIQCTSIVFFDKNLNITNVKNYNVKKI
jgi:hypothetical protein